jgi:hypothetical protein
MYGYEPPAADASKSNKQYTKNVWLHTDVLASFKLF